MDVTTLIILSIDRNNLALSEHQTTDHIEKFEGFELHFELYPYLNSDKNELEDLDIKVDCFKNDGDEEILCHCDSGSIFEYAKENIPIVSNLNNIKVNYTDLEIQTELSKSLERIIAL